MPIAIVVAGVLGLIVVLIAYYRDAPLEQRRLQVADWDLLPDPSDVARTQFPLSFPGYDPAAVEHHFDQLNRAYADLLAVAPPDVVARARHRAAMRSGREFDGEAASAAPGALSAEATGSSKPATSTSSGPGRGQPPRRTASSFTGEVDDAEALRAEAALADIDARTRPDARR